ncbi:MAG: hypothetical protein PHE15_04955, partial [Dehalococcoidales bacterium]|nr:hypothetical protein [Dehalococcoidales bacterium]
MKNKILKILGLVMTIAMLSSFMVAGTAVTAAGSATTMNTWEGLTLPGTSRYTDVKLLEQADDGTLFATVASFTPGTFTFTGSDTGCLVIEANGDGNQAYITFSSNGDFVEWGSANAIGDGVYALNIVDTYGGSYTVNLKGTMTLVTAAGGDTIALSGMLYGPSSAFSDNVDDLVSGSFDFYKGYIGANIAFTDAGTISGPIANASETLYKSTDGYVWTKTCFAGVGVITAVAPADNYALNNSVYVAIDTSAMGYTSIY